MSYPPSMVHKSGNKLVVRSVVSGDKLFGTEDAEDETSIGNGEVTIKRTGFVADEALSPECSVVVDQDEELPQCKVKRNYACSSCSYYTQNPRYYLHHLKNVHKEKIRIYECPHCLYASKHSQKLQRHIHMVHVMGKRKMLIKAKSSPNRKNPSSGGGVGKTNSPLPEIAATLLSIGSAEDDKKEPVCQLPDEDLTASTTLNTIDEVELASGGDLTAGSSAAASVVAEIQEEITNETVGADVPLKCSLCPFSSRNPNLVTRHERLVHLKKKFYRCTKCDYITHMKARFTKHVKYHSMPMIKCDMCDFRTPYKWNLDRHNKNHFANGAFKCSQCNFTADIKQSLTVHEMNHHVPPVNQNGAGGMTIPTPAKRRCRVGASDIIAKQQENNTNIDPDLDDLELLRMERESLPNADAANADDAVDATVLDTSAVAVDEPAGAQMTGVEITMVKPNSSGGGKTLSIKNLTAAAYLNGTLKPEDVILTKNGSVYVKKFKCRVCHYKAAWESEMIRHEVRVHGLEAAPKKKPLPRPIPNLIPIQGGGSGGNGGNGGAKPKSSNENSPAKSILDEFTGPLTEKDLNDICAKSCATSSLKDFASLIGADEIKSERLKDLMTMFSSVNEDKEKNDKATPDKRSNADSSSDTSPSDPTKKLPDAFKKKNATFFDRLKEKLMVGAGENGNLVCWCGHKSKCLSESLMHQKQHNENNEKNEKSVVNGPVISGAELSSTRCQHCRQRCKTSSDLYVHLQSCPEILKKGNCAEQANGLVTLHANESEDVEDDADMETFADEEEFVENEPEIKEENKVFVWNSFPEEKEEFADEYGDEENRSKSPASEASLVGYEIAPGIGSVVSNNNESATTITATSSTDRFNKNNVTADVTNQEIAVKKVFKCPECTFWASTASRFHVHIVSHLNVKPFGCSVCAYQSKWKWDVTKHIRLKKERDATHEHAEMRTIDVETGRRNYTKYNKFLTFMRVQEPDSDTSKSSSKPQSPVPILPKLTPAPSVDGDGAKTSSDVSIRPLPQLHPANPSVSLKRIHEAGDDSEIPKKKAPSEKKMWKCKKCKFRNTDRNVVLSHVKEHYTGGGNANGAAYSQEARNQTEGQNVNQSSSQLIASGESSNQNTKEGNYKCKQCVFETNCPTTFIQHNRHHEPNPSAYFKCCFCPFYANDKQFMMNHIVLHGVKNVEESLPLITQNVPKETDDIEESEFNEPMDTGVNGAMISVGVEEHQMEVYKRFKCTSCPYVTNNKSQYLYHRQFHRLRGAPFKCNVCTYNVTKRHLLHQHLKIHGIKRAQFKNCINDAVEKETTEPNVGPSMKLNTEIETTNFTDIPLVWVYKSGSLTKMFKCRHCPHVNLRKSNIHEHEKMHFDRVQRSPNGSVNPNQSSVHRCTECNYVCNNAGALASHFKVHQGAFGQICALADPRRSDESQCKEITKLIKEDERFSKKACAAREQQADDLKRRLSAVAASIDVGSPVRVHETVDATITTFESPIPEAYTNPPPDEKKVLHFCNVCPARFLYLNDLDSHSRFHGSHHAFKCNSCTYSAPQAPHLSAHRRVHSQEYYDKTNQMCMIYETSKDYARPKTTYIVDKPGFPGLGWIVMLTSHKTNDNSGKPKVMVKQYSCHKCPAQFFKSVALQHHLTLHGGKDPYQCRSCDYRVKTYGNLIKHEAVHGLEPRMKAKALKNKKQSGNSSIPCSGTELFQHRTEQIAKEQTTPSGPTSAVSINPASLPVDPEFGVLMHGSPEFVYPTTLKNGKMKDKRYKCHKCPSAFEKREQYKVHLLLHGAKYKYKCEKCDYAVKYYANYAQHMRKHDFNEKRLSERRASIVSKASEESGTDTPSESNLTGAGLVNGTGLATDNDRVAYAMEKKDLNGGDAMVCNGKASKTLHISIADQQAVVLMQQKITDNVNLADQLHRCYYCPYSHQRKDAVENHERCHFNNKGSYVCEFCNYTVPQPHFLREHQKLHFGSMKGIKAEAFMKCDRLEIWMETEEGKVLIFKDNGSGDVKEESRFEPNLSVNEEESEYKKMYVDVKTGEEFTPKKLSPNPEELLDSCSDKEKHLSKPFNLSDVPVKLSESSSSSSMSSYSSPNRVKEEDDDDDEDEILDDEMFDEVKKEQVYYGEIHQDDEVAEDEADADADADAADAEPDQDEIVEPVDDDDMIDIEESVMIEPDEDDVKEEEENFEDPEPEPDDEVGLTSDLEYNDTDMDTETENTNMENSHIDNCADTQEMAAKEEEAEARTTALVPEEAEGFATKTVDDETRLSGDDSDSEDSDSSSSSSTCSSSSCSSKSSNDGTSNLTSNATTDDEDSKGDVIKESIINSNTED